MKKVRKAREVYFKAKKELDKFANM